MRRSFRLNVVIFICVILSSSAAYRSQNAAPAALPRESPTSSTVGSPEPRTRLWSWLDLLSLRAIDWGEARKRFVSFAEEIPPNPEWRDRYLRYAELFDARYESNRPLWERLDALDASGSN